MGDGIEVWDGRLYQTLEWQSPAFAEYGYDEDSAGFRIEPPVDHVHGEVAVIVDTEPRRGHLSNSERSVVQEAVAHASQVLVAFNGEELSGTGGTWRSATQPAGGASVTLFGLESVTSALLVATLVYLNFAATIRWKHVNYQDSI